MISQSSLPIQNSTGSKPDISRRADKNPDSIGAAQVKPATSFTTELKDNIINVYERSEAKIAVPDERSGVDRRRSAGRQLSSLQSAPLPSAKNVTASYLYPTNQTIKNTYTWTENTPPAIFSPSAEKGTLIDIWI
jgi:hypothetical protein